jgi:DNA-directed RNA polymerase subunit K/omega
MKYKSDAQTAVTRDVLSFEAGTGNIYETLAICSKRANQISHELKEELNAKLSEFNTATDSLEEIFENREQIEISKFYERLPKSTLVALQEYSEGKIYFRRPEPEAAK